MIIDVSSTIYMSLSLSLFVCACVCVCARVCVQLCNTYVRHRGALFPFIRRTSFIAFPFLYFQSAYSIARPARNEKDTVESRFEITRFYPVAVNFTVYSL